MDESLNEEHPPNLRRPQEAESIRTRPCLRLRNGHLTGLFRGQDFDKGCQSVDQMQEHASFIKKASLYLSCPNEPLGYIASRLFAKLTNLVELELFFWNCGVSANDMKAILEALENMPHLQRFHLKKCDLRESKKEIVGLLMQILPSIRSLGISRNQLHLALELSMLVSGTELSLDVSQNRITKEFGSLIFDGCAVRLDPFLDCLELSCRNMSDVEYKSLLGRIPTSLTHLALNHGSIGDEGATATVSTLATNHKALKILKLHHSEIGTEGAVALANELVGNLGLLEFLDLHGNDIGDEGAMVLGKVFSKNHESSLKSLDLGYNGIGSHGLIGLVESLESIKFLGLSQNGFGDNGAAALRIAFSRNHKASIDVLDVSRNEIGVRGAMEFANMLGGSHKPFKQLKLHHNDFGDEGAMALANALAGNRFLESLELDHSNIEDEGVIALAGALAKNKCLERLDLAENKIGDRGAAGLAEMLQSNSVLESLILWYNKDITENGRKALCCAMQHNRTLEFLLLPEEYADCCWAQGVQFFTGCNSLRFWKVMQTENAMIPWHKAFHVLLTRKEDSFGLWMVFVLLQNRPDILEVASRACHSDEVARKRRRIG